MPRLVRLSILVLAALAASAATAGATTIRVPTTADGAGCTLRAAIADVDSAGAAPTGCPPAGAGANTILLPRGTLALSQGTELFVAPNVADLTILGAGETATTVSGNGTSRVLEVAAGANVTARDLTLANGQAPPSTTPEGSPAAPAADGGAVSNAGTLTLADAAIQNSSAGVGAAGESADGGPGGDGGAIYNTGSVLLAGVTMIGNGSGVGGEGGYLSGDSGLVYLAGGIGGNGGAIANIGGSLTIDSSTFADNAAGSGGEPLVSSIAAGPDMVGGSGGDGGDGGAIWTNGGSVAIVNSTFASNSAGIGGTGAGAGASGNGGYGGALAADATASVTLRSDTIAGNSASADGGGVGAPAPAPAAPGTYLYGYRLAGVTMMDTLLSRNSGGNCADPALFDAGHNLSFEGSGCPSTFRGRNPQLEALQGNGGPAETFALEPHSAALRAGADCPSTDERGAPRRRPCAIGAYQPAAPTIRPQGAATSATVVRIHALIALYAGGATVTVRFGAGRRLTRVLTFWLGPNVRPTPVTIRVRGLKPRTAYRYLIAVATSDGSAQSSLQTLRTVATGSRPRSRRRRSDHLLHPARQRAA